jgi:hypothetical protein
MGEVGKTMKGKNINEIYSSLHDFARLAEPNTMQGVGK